jgi:YHS domain-containing protein
MEVIEKIGGPALELEVVVKDPHGGMVVRISQQHSRRLEYEKEFRGKTYRFCCSAVPEFNPIGYAEDKATIYLRGSSRGADLDLMVIGREHAAIIRQMVEEYNEQVKVAPIPLAKGTILRGACGCDPDKVSYLVVHTKKGDKLKFISGERTGEFWRVQKDALVEAIRFGDTHAEMTWEIVGHADDVKSYITK